MRPGSREWDVVVIGGGPAGSVLGCLLAQSGFQVLILERDLHPREHVGESLTPSTNFVFAKIGFLEKMEKAGFVHKPGAAWTAPRSPVGKFLAIRLNEFPMPGARQPYTYNVEREELDALLLQHALAAGAEVLQQVRVEEVLMQEGRAAGVLATAAGWRQDISARFVVDASGRRCLLATQLGLKVNDPEFSQFAIYSWFENVEPAPPGAEGMLFLHFLGLERAWAWQIPLRHGIWSVGFVTDRADFKKAGTSEDGFAAQLIQRNANLSHNLRHAQRIRPWRTEGDYSYRISQVAGRGWLLVGDALRFVDPIFSTGVDVAAYSALHAHDAIKAVLTGGDERAALARYEHTVGDGVEAWYELIRLFYRLQNLFTYFAVRRDTREEVVRILQGNLYDPVALARAREMIDLMQSAYARVTRDSNNLLRPGALTAG